MSSYAPVVLHYLWAAHFAVLVWIITLAILYSHLAKRNRLPTVASFQAFTTQIDSRGGNIVALSFFVCWTLIEIHWGRLPQNFWTGQASGAFIGALLKTMTGGGSVSRTGDANNGTIKPYPVPAPPKDPPKEATP